MGHNLIVERTFAYSLNIIRLCRDLKRDRVGELLGKQLLRSGTSIGANVYEAQGGQSRADFIAKLSIAHKEAREAAYWLRLIDKSGILGTPGATPDAIVSANNLASLQNETSQLIKILSSILLTAKRRGKNP